MRVPLSGIIRLLSRAVMLVKLIKNTAVSIRRGKGKEGHQ